VKRVRAVGLPIQAVEDGFTVAHIVQRTEFGAVEEAPAALGVGGEEVAELRAAKSEGGFLANGAEGAVLRGEAAEGFCPSPERVTALTTRLVLSPNSAPGAPVMSSMDWMALSGIWVENCLLC